MKMRRKMIIPNAEDFFKKPEPVKKDVFKIPNFKKAFKTGKYKRSPPRTNTSRTTSNRRGSNSKRAPSTNARGKTSTNASQRTPTVFYEEP
ncbi:hypothetical protein NPIL_620321 [Nephila pilipes]|uniref:Uncharacterized protein n=1 Tax=Nephila pilipes TaxID=299642 RepID=A0A8X6T3I7_NEPPI|nr:hypothetical protein NPIL_620321 [Nephila pilipes]